MGGHEYQDRMKNVGLYTHPRNWFLPLPPFTLEPQPKGSKATTVFLYFCILNPPPKCLAQISGWNEKCWVVHIS